jgi:predicted peroxiredoxin
MNSNYGIVRELIEYNCDGVDKYIHNNSTWLIFTDDKKWVIELTKDGTLWYNYNFFKDVFKYLSLDVVENQHYITKWVEETIITGVNYTGSNTRDESHQVEDTIINGVKNTSPTFTKFMSGVEETIQNGVKETIYRQMGVVPVVENTIQNGVRHTRRNGDSMNTDAEDTIQNGVKYTCQTMNPKWKYVEDTIQTGVKYTSWHEPILLGTKVEDAIQNGVKDTKNRLNRDIRVVEDTLENGINHTEYGDWLDGDEIFDEIIQNGIKETKSPGADGDLLSTLEWMESNNTVNIPKLIDDVIENGVKRTEGGVLFDETKVDRIISEGVKETKGGGYLGSIEMKGKMVHQLESPKQNEEVEEVIEHGVKLTNSSLQIDGSCVVEDVIQNGIKETHDDVYHHKGRVDDVIKNGVKQCIPSHTPLYNPMDFSVVYRENHRLDDVASVLEKGIKEVQPLPSQEGNMDWGNYYHRQEDRTKPHTKYVDDVITSGIKKTKAMDEWVNTTNIVGKVIDNGIKE